jgi:hypothetical protein
MGTTIRDLPILDLRAISAESIDTIDRVENVRTVVLNTNNAEAFMRVPRNDVRSHLIIRPDEKLSIGQIEFGDDYLEGLQDGTRLVILGHLLIDGFNTSLFIRKVRAIRVYGQVLYSDSKSVSALLARLERLQGQLLDMPPNAQRWIGNTYLDEHLLKAVRGLAVASIGPITIDTRVTPGDIHNSIRSMVQIGEIKGKEEAVCGLLSVCSRRLGTFTLS